MLEEHQLVVVGQSQLNATTLMYDVAYLPDSELRYAPTEKQLSALQYWCAMNNITYKEGDNHAH